MIRNREDTHVKPATLPNLGALSSAFPVGQPAGSTWAPYREIQSRYMTDEVTPDFRARRNSGELIMNPLTSYRVRTFSVGSLLVTGSNVGSFPFQLNATINPFSVNDRFSTGSSKISAPINRNATELFCTKVEKACNATAMITSSAQRAGQLAFAQRGNNIALIGADFAELGKTISLFPNIISDALSLLRSFHKAAGLRGVANASRDDWLHVLREASSLWLACRYGVRPLVYTLRSYIVGLAEQYESMRMTSRGCADDKTYRTYHDWLTTQDGVWRLYFETDLSVSISTKATIVDQVDLDLANLAALRTGADRIIETAWELVPYSFVVDWFIDVSNWLQAWHPKWDATLGAACTTTRVAHTMRTYGFRVTPYAAKQVLPGRITYNGTLSCTNPTCGVRVDSVRRSPGSYLPLTPSFKLRLNTLKVVDLLSMLGQLLPNWLRQLRHS